MAVGKDKTGVLVNMDKTLKSELEQLAKEDNRSLTSYIINVLKKLDDNEIARLFGVSEANITEGETKATIEKDDDPVCERCRNHKKDAVMRENGSVLCSRCLAALGEE